MKNQIDFGRRAGGGWEGGGGARAEKKNKTKASDTDTENLICAIECCRLSLLHKSSSHFLDRIFLFFFYTMVRSLHLYQTIVYHTFKTFYVISSLGPQKRLNYFQ